MSNTFSKTSGRSVVASDSGETIGEVKDYVVDLATGKVEAIHISGRGKKAQLVSWSNVNSFGTDAIMVGSQTTEPGKDRLNIIGSKVLTTNGNEAGKVEDVEFDESTGALVSVITDQGVVELARLRSLGSYALVIDA